MIIKSKNRKDHRGNNKYYQTKTHKTWREKIRQKSNGLCVHCLDPERVNKNGKKGKVYRQGNTADHILPIEAGGSKDSLDNGQWLCPYHHAVKSVEDKKYYE